MNARTRSRAEQSRAEHSTASHTNQAGMTNDVELLPPEPCPALPCTALPCPALQPQQLRTLRACLFYMTKRTRAAVDRFGYTVVGRGKARQERGIQRKKGEVPGGDFDEVELHC